MCICALDSKTNTNGGRRHFRALLPHLPPRQCQPPPQPPGRRRGALHLQARVPARGRPEVTRQGLAGEAQEAAHRAARHGHDRNMHGHRGRRPHAGDLGYTTLLPPSPYICLFQLQPNLNLLDDGSVSDLCLRAFFCLLQCSRLFQGSSSPCPKINMNVSFFNQVAIFLLQVLYLL